MKRYIKTNTTYYPINSILQDLKNMFGPLGYDVYLQPGSGNGASPDMLVVTQDFDNYNHIYDETVENDFYKILNRYLDRNDYGDINYDEAFNEDTETTTATYYADLRNSLTDNYNGTPFVIYE